MIFTLVILVLALACDSPSSEAERSTVVSHKVIVDQEAYEQDAKAAQEAYPFPVYTHFDQLAPLFESESDTTYVINFWATWCKPCVKELPYFEQLHNRYAGEKVRIVLVSLDFAKQLDTKLVPFVQEHQLKSEVVVLLDDRYNDWIDRVEPAWTGAIPVTLIYKGGARKFIPHDVEDFAELEAELKEILRS